MATRILRIGRRIDAKTSRFVDALERLARLSGAKTPEWPLGRRLQQFEIDTQRLRYTKREGNSPASELGAPRPCGRRRACGGFFRRRQSSRAQAKPAPSLVTLAYCASGWRLKPPQVVHGSRGCARSKCRSATPSISPSAARTVRPGGGSLPRPRCGSTRRLCEWRPIPWLDGRCEFRLHGRRSSRHRIERSASARGGGERERRGEERARGCRRTWPSSCKASFRRPSIRALDELLSCRPPALAKSR